MSNWEPIPGETPIETDGLLVKSVMTRAELSKVEAENIRKAVIKYLAGPITKRTAKFDVGWVLQLHEEMFGKVWAWAGQCRSVELNIGVPAYTIQAELQTLLDDLQYWRDDADTPFIEQSPKLHHRAVQIHPFRNGNGRWARLLANVWLHLHKQPYTEWPDDSLGVESKVRTEYLGAIRKADEFDYGPLIALHDRFTPSDA